MESFKEEEIDVLIEALDSWESKDFGGEVLGMMLEAMIGDKMSEESKIKMVEDKKKQDAEKEQKKKMRKETSVLLKAKLIQFKQSLGIRQLQSL